MSWIAVADPSLAGGLSAQGCDIELLIQDALFERFGTCQPDPNQLQFLHDNGPEYLEKKLQECLKDWKI
ncbi:hypothetical protein GCM10023091_00010 [Ravibacter arvi]|uniref:Uncharacterized protein n=1 Tax=Ravibacter arvi TaxID=2051041 RepID=A0ABP8LKP4_9BACT